MHDAHSPSAPNAPGPGIAGGRLLLALCLFACGPAMAQGKGAANPGAGKPIKVGAISSLSGGAAFPESAQAVKAYFDTINAEGGIRGRKLVLVSEDDRNDPKAARGAARRLDEQEVVAHVGSASTLECGVNAAHYASRNLVSVQGTGVDPDCFRSANIAPVNAGPYLSLDVALRFATEIRGRQKVCLFFMNIPALMPGYEEVVAKWKARTGRTPHLYDVSYLPGAPTAPVVDKVRQSGCEAAVFTGVEPFIIDWMRNVRSKNIAGVDWIFLTPAYTAGVAKALGAQGEGIYSLSEFMPWSSRALDLNDWRDTMKRGKVPLTSFSQGGYLAAQIFVSVLRGIKGDITRESVAQAFRALERYDSPLIGTPYSFGTAARHNPNHAILPMVLRDGEWRIAHPDWIIAGDS